MKVKLNDNVLVTTGKDKGKVGKVVKTLCAKSKVVVEGVNMRTKHIKKTQNAKGRKIQFEGPISVSNVKIVCPETKKASRIGYLVKSGNKIRIAKKTGVELDKKHSEVKN